MSRVEALGISSPASSIVVNDKQLFESMELIRRVAQRIVFSHDAQIVTGMREGFYPVPAL